LPTASRCRRSRCFPPARISLRRWRMRQGIGPATLTGSTESLAGSSATTAMRSKSCAPYLDSLRRPQHCSKVGDGRPR
jgi:hypothetical protein